MQRTIVPPTMPDYEDSILNLSCSILKHYGITPQHPTLPDADALLSRNYRHVVVILLDGLGMNILEKHLSKNDFLRRSLLKDYSSVFPPTTTASTTSFLSGLSPIEHGWLGWDVYFEQEQKTVCCFNNTIQDTEEQAAEYNVARKYLSYKNIIDQINESGKAEANIVFPFGPQGFPKFSDWIAQIKKTVKKPNRTFTYAYWEAPDNQLHKDGTNAKSIKEIVEDLNASLLDLCESSPETAFFITADHGHIDIEDVHLQEDYPEIAKMLVRAPSIEPRAISFYIKDEYKKDFPDLFNKHFGQDYVLFSKDEAMEAQLFGPGFEHENLTGIGDYIAASVDARTIFWNKKHKPFHSHHAGLSREEMRIPLIFFEHKPHNEGWYAYGIIALMIVVCLLVAIL